VVLGVVHGVDMVPQVGTVLQVGNEVDGGKEVMHDGTVQVEDSHHGAFHHGKVVDGKVGGDVRCDGKVHHGSQAGIHCDGILLGKDPEDGILEGCTHPDYTDLDGLHVLDAAQFCDDPPLSGGDRVPRLEVRMVTVNIYLSLLQKQQLLLL